MSIVKEYYDNGALKAKGIRENGLKEGKWIFYFEDGEMLREIYFRNDVEDGEWKMWHKSGSLYIEQMKVLGKSEGYWKEYYENGNIKEIGEYKNGEYFPVDFWDEGGVQLLKKGTGKKIEKFGYLELDICEQYFEDGKFIKEVKISSAQYGGFGAGSK
jgi:antitoxin component YwqK of YwqJK toxin-antitoxin module